MNLINSPHGNIKQLINEFQIEFAHLAVINYYVQQSKSTRGAPVELRYKKAGIIKTFTLFNGLRISDSAISTILFFYLFPNKYQNRDGFLFYF